MGKNKDGELLIATKGTSQGDETFVANYDDGLGGGEATAGITVAEIEFSTYRLWDAVFNGIHFPSGWLETTLEAFHVVWKAYTGEPLKPGVDPLVLDLDGDGIELRPQVLTTPHFDLDNDGFSEPTGWVMPDDGFLAVDLDDNGTLDGIHELFGSATQDGFSALASYDSNLDGVIDANDTNFADLRIWQDSDTDARTDAGELKTLADFDITSISLAATDPLAGEEELDGNLIASVSSFTRGDGSTSTIADVILTVDNFKTTFIGDTSITAGAALLPELKGFGVLADLRVAMSRDDDFRLIVESQISNLNSLDIPTIRAAALPIFSAWVASETSGSLNRVNNEDIPILSFVNTEGQSEIVDFGIIDSTQGHWVLASGQDVLDENDVIIEAPTAQDIRDIDLSTFIGSGYESYSWRDLSTAEISFFEHYLGDSIAIGVVPSNEVALSEVISSISGFLAQMDQTLDILSVRLAAQGPLNSFFVDIGYDVEKDAFTALTDRQLAPVYEQILSAAETESSPYDYLENWARLIKLVIADFDRGEDHLKVSYDYMFANVVAAYEATNSSLNILDASEALSIPRDLLITGTGTLVGTDDYDVFYLNGGDQIAKGGSGYDVYVVGENFGNDVIEDIETHGESHIPDLIRFADTKSTDVIATREGEDLVISVIATGDTLRVVRQFEGETPNLFGGFIDEGTGVGEIAFVDGVVWDAFDIAKAVSHRDDSSLDIIGTDSIDYLDGGAGDDRLEGAGNGDVYYFGTGYGHDTIFDEMTNLLVNGDDFLIFENGLSFSDVTFTRNGGSNDLEISLNGTIDTLTIENQFNVSHTGPFGIQHFNRIEIFSFGTFYYTNEEIMQEVLKNLQTDGDDTIYGFYRQDTLDGGTGDDFLSGGNDSDTYIFGKGYGQDVVEDNADIILTPSIDRVLFAQDVAVEDVIFNTSGSDKSITISFIDDDSTLHINNQFDAAYTGPFGTQWFDRIETFEFQDENNTIYTWDDIAVEVLENAKTEGDDTIYGFDLEDTLDGGLGDDFLSGGNENDTYIYGLGYGHDIIDEDFENIFSGDFDLVSFVDGITLSDLTWNRDGDSNHAVAHLSEQDSLTIINQFNYGGIGTGSFDEIEEYHFSDGTVLTLQGLRDLLLQEGKTDGDDDIYGYYTDDFLDGGLGDDLLSGLDGDDTYYFDIGYGHDTINDKVKIVTHSNEDKIIFGSGFSADNLVLQRNGANLDIFFTNSVDQLTIIKQNTGLDFDQIEEFHFSDGTIWDLAHITAIAENITGTIGDDILNGSPIHDNLNGLAGNDELNGGSGSDNITGGLGDDLLKGSYGADTYFYNIGDGDDELYDIGYLASHETDKVLLGTGLLSTDAILTVDALDDDDVILSFEGIEGSIYLNEQIGGNSGRGIEEIHFSDGVVWDRDDILANFVTPVGLPTITGTDGNDTLTGTSSDENLDGGLGDDTLNGNQGADRYLYSSGDGNDTIYDSRFNSGADQLIFNDLNASDITFERSSTDLDDVFIRVNATNEVITLNEQLQSNNEKAGIEEIVYADGSIQEFSLGTVRELAKYVGTDGDDTITGNSYLDVFDTGLGDDSLDGKQGADRYLYSSGDGNDTIYDSRFNSGADQLIFNDLNASDITLSVSTLNSNDMLVSINDTNEVIMIDNQFYNANGGIEEIVFADASVLLSDDFLT